MVKGVLAVRSEEVEAGLEVLIQLSKDHTDRETTGPVILLCRSKLNSTLDVLLSIEDRSTRSGRQHIFVAVHTKCCVKMSAGDVI